MATFEDVETGRGAEVRDLGKGFGLLARLRDLITGEGALASEVLRTTRTAYVVTDRRGAVAMMNEAAQAQIGPLVPGDVLREVLSHIAQDVDALAEVAARNGFASRTAHAMHGGNERWYDVSARRIRRPRGGLIWRLEQITESKRRHIWREKSPAQR